MPVPGVKGTISRMGAALGCAKPCKLVAAPATNVSAWRLEIERNSMGASVGTHLNLTNGDDAIAAPHRQA
jgi:hypothetical protein